MLCCEGCVENKTCLVLVYEEIMIIKKAVQKVLLLELGLSSSR